MAMPKGLKRYQKLRTKAKDMGLSAKGTADEIEARIKRAGGKIPRKTKSGSSRRSSRGGSRGSKSIWPPGFTR